MFAAVKLGLLRDRGLSPHAQFDRQMLGEYFLPHIDDEEREVLGPLTNLSHIFCIFSSVLAVFLLSHLLLFRLSIYPSFFESFNYMLYREF